MRRSTSVQLGLLPMLASAAVASAQSAPDPVPPTPVPAGVDPAGAPPGATTAAPPLDSLPLDFDTRFAPPGLTEPVLAPPGMTPPLDCDEDPDWAERPECTVGGGIVRGGFGHYFWIAHG